MKIDYNNLYTHFVFTVFERQRNIPEKNRVRIEKYTTGIVNRNKSKLYAIYANPEHVHLLLSRSPEIGEEELATIIADSSESFINENRLSTISFHWQQSASAFSVSKSHVDKVCKYILDQPEHHKKFSFADEYEKFLKFYEETIRNKVNKVDDVL
jgi:REP element-mobilizing transposase RayT